MATHDYNLANQSGADFRADLNNALSAILSNNASATEPTTTTAYMLWVDTTNNLLKMRNSSDNAWITLPVSITTSNTVDIDGGTVNTITSLSFSSGETVTTILDEDDLSSDSASALATQQSIKAYVDSQVTAQDLDFQGDTGGALSIDLDSETFTISGGNGIDTSGALNTLTIAIDSSVVTLTDTQTLTNKTIDADSNTISNLEVDNLKSGVLDTDLTSISASDDTLASAKAIKTYVDAQVTAQDLDLTDGTTSISIDLDSETLSVLGGTGVTSTASGNGVTLAIGQDVGTTADVTFNTVSADLTGDVTGTVSSIANHSTSDLSEGTNLYYTTARFDSAFSGKSTTDLTEGTNLYFTDERVDDRVNSLLVAGSNVTLTYDDVANTLTIAATEDNLSNNDTDDLAEGSTNLYFTDARARAAISASGDLSYNSTTGVISFTERTDAEVRGLVSASGDLSYNSTTGVFSFTERTDAEVRGLISASGDLSYNSTTGVISFTERTDAEVRGLISGGTGVTYNNTTGVISIGQAVGTSDNVTFGDVIVSGDLTVSGTTTTVNTETINLADNIILFNSNATGTPTENAGIEIERGDATNKTLLWNETDDKWTVGSETFVAGTFEGALTGNVTGTVSSLANHDTDDLSQGSTNLYYADSLVDSHLSGGTGVTYSSGTISIGQAVGTGDSVTFAGVSSDFTGDIDGAVKFTAKADVALTKGQAVYISGVSGTVPTVNLADADNASAMPAFGLVYANANANAEVEIVTFGSLTGLNTSAFTVGKSIYISTTAGALTTTAPTGESSLIQNIGMVQRSHAADGIIKVGGAGRTNATPNLNSGKIFYGNGSNQSTPTTLDTSIVPENTNLYYTDARARSAISVSGNALSYDSGTGVITSNYEESPTFTGTVTVTGEIVANGGIALGDNDKAIFGTGSDLQIYHDGSHSYIDEQGTGRLYINSGNGVWFGNADASEIQAKINVDAACEFRYDNSIKLATTSTGIDVTGDVSIGDGSSTATRLLMGTGDDSKMFHNGIDTYWINDTGNIIIRNQSDDKDILLQTDDGAGGTTTYITVDGSETDVSLHYGGSEKLATTTSGIDVTGTVTADGLTVDGNATLQGASSPTLRITDSDTPTTAFISSTNASTRFGSETNTDVFLMSNNTFRVQIDGSTGDISFYEDTGTTAQMTWDASADALTFGDSVKATFGASSDLAIYHDGSNSYVRDDGTGDLRIQATNLRIEATSGEDYLYCASDGAVTLYYDNAPKLATSATGIDVTGTVTADGLTVDTNTLYVDSTNNRVGIGTTSPDSILHIEGSGVDSLRFGNIGESGNSALRISRDDTSISGNPLGYLEFGGKDNTGNVDTAHAYIGAIAGTHAAGSNPTNLTFGTTPSGSSTILERMRIDESGNVGIGTDSPSNILHISASAPIIRLTDTDTSAYGLVSASATDGSLILEADAGNTVANSDMIFRVDSSEHMRIDSSGNVGIGQTSPSADLEIKRAGSSTIRLTNALDVQSANDIIGEIEFYSAENSSPNDSVRADITAINEDTLNNVALAFGTAASAGNVTERMRIDSSGNVGIGTSSPATALDVVGTVTADGLDLGATTDAATVSTTPSDYQIQLGAANSTTGDIGRNISFETNDIVTASINSYDAGATSATGLAFFTGTSSTLRRFLDIGSGGDISFYENTGTTAKLFWDASAESLGIGTTSPANLMHIEGTSAVVSATQLTLEGRYAGYGAGIDFVSRTSSGGTRVSMAKITADGENSWNTTASTQDAGLRFFTAADGTLSERLRINSSGNVGIGTTSPTDTLSVGTLGSGTPTITIGSGTANSGYLYFGDGTGADRYRGYLQYAHSTDSLQFGSAGSERMRIDSLGNVGIGTTSVFDSNTRLELKKSGNCQFFISSSDTSGVRIVASAFGSSYGKIGTFSNHDFLFTTNDTERMRITSTGAIFMPALSYASASTDLNYNTSTGEVFVVTSSRRYKSNIADLDIDTSKVLALRPVSYTDNNSGINAVGLIAEEVHEEIPQLVNYKEIEGYDEIQPDSVKYSTLSVYLLKAIQEQQVLIEQLQAEVALLKGE